MLDFNGGVVVAELGHVSQLGVLHLQNLAPHVVVQFKQLEDRFDFLQEKYFIKKKIIKKVMN